MRKVGKLFTFWTDLGEEKQTRILHVAGWTVALFALFTLLSAGSHFFTWKQDMSLLRDPGMMDASEPVGNLAGKAGARWGQFLVGRCFGIAALVLAFFLSVLAAKMIRRSLRIPVLKYFLATLTGTFLLSFVLAFAGLLAGVDTAFGGGLGGEAGATVVGWGINLLGPLLTGAVLLVLCGLWAFCLSRRFSDWMTGARPADPDIDMDGPEEAAQVFDEDDDPEQDMEEIALVGEDEPAESEEVPGPVSPFADLSGADFAGAEEADGPAAADPAAGEEGGLEVVRGEGLETEVKKELPRIDNRAELPSFKFPPLDLLGDYISGRHEVSQDELERNNNKIRATLANYKIQVRDVKAIVGPTVTLYKVYPAPGVKIAAIKSLQEDIAMSLNARGVRIVTLSDAVGIEVANDRPSIVPLKALLNDAAFRESKAELPVAIGYTITQQVKVFDLADAPHLLVAGATKQGKSVGLNVIVSSLLYAKHPSELKFVFVDPKMVEFTAYGRLLYHYLAVLPTASGEQEEMDKAIVKNAKDAAAVLKSLCIEMDDRYELLAKAGVNNIKRYNEKYKDRHLLPTEGHHFLPYIVTIIDEYADLTMSTGAGPESKALARSITTSVIRLAQKGRAAGLHVILATQRPTVDVVTGLIKTNFPMRIAFRVTSRVDSMTILDNPGADKLIGKGDMLIYSGIEMERVQCGYVDGDEVQAIDDFIGDQKGYKKSYNTPYYLPETAPESGEEGGGMVDMKDIDERFEEAARLIVTSQRGSTSDLQRRLGMGYAKAGRVMDQLEAAGIVGPQQGSKPREVLVKDFAELDNILSHFLNK